ncbi:FecR family protein [Chitinophaga sancti]|uniref:FecR family protein n=1 Tax=Chitinophaga sancti TaxID=1004 RepID=A0A1K1QYT8_9BACT|nr:FecR family protein [Chitinophaga sancti]WQD62071.1 FecR family protein [Chitinophaga sancti]WQG92360.1 FecR family protein [Chitinophaga sancti]SFW64779.1 FecR family protein [Chitinophaga sancti]
MQRELIDKYFRNECSDEERKQVKEYLMNNPGEWNRYVNEADWDNFITNDELDPGLTEKLYTKVSEQTFKKRSKGRIYWMAAAAVAVLLVGTVWTYLMLSHTSFSKAGISAFNSGKLAETANTSDSTMRLILADGSLVMLAPHSSIRYHEPFSSGKSRIIYLEGKASFDVNSDRNRPFIVHADRLVTTVLGTSFTIDAFNENNFVKVKLHKGKIQVAPINNVHEKWNEREILKPGDELTYDKGTMLASVKRYVPVEKLVKAGPLDIKNINIRRPDIYTFDISPLSDVFDQLSVYYQVDIYYYPSEIQDKYFSGKMRKSDTLETILNDIGLLNHLKIVKDEQHYIISKKN